MKVEFICCVDKATDYSTNKPWTRSNNDFLQTTLVKKQRANSVKGTLVIITMVFYKENFIE